MQVHQADQVPMRHQEPPARKAHQVQQVKPVPQVPQVNPVFPHKMSHSDQVNQVKPVMQVHQVRQVHQATLVKMVKLVHPVPRVPRVHKAPLVPMVNQVPQVHQVHPVTKARKVFAPSTAPWMVVCSSRMERDDKLTLIYLLLHTICDDAQTTTTTPTISPYYLPPFTMPYNQDTAIAISILTVNYLLGFLSFNTH